MPEPDLFGHVAEHELTDAELGDLFRRALTCPGRLPRETSIHLGMPAPEYLVDQLRLANLVVVERRRGA